MTSKATPLPVPEPGREAAIEFVRTHLGHLFSGPLTASSIRGGQRAADHALAGFDVTGYAASRNEVAPVHRRGASTLSPYIRHGLLPLQQVWDAVSDGPGRDVTKFRDELLWQEYARHWYARLGGRTRSGVRRELTSSNTEAGWDRDMLCLDLVLGELEDDGWLVNQTRMWLASHWSVRSNRRWQEGEDFFFQHLLDGSRAANRLGWQWTTGVGSSKHYGFSRWQVNALELGRPAAVLADRHVSVTHAPVPGFGRITASAPPAEVHPWPWLRQPNDSSVASFSAWRKRT